MKRKEKEIKLIFFKKKSYFSDIQPGAPSVFELASHFADTEGGALVLNTLQAERKTLGRTKVVRADSASRLDVDDLAYIAQSLHQLVATRRIVSHSTTSTRGTNNKSRTNTGAPRCVYLFFIDLFLKKIISNVFLKNKMKKVLFMLLLMLVEMKLQLALLLKEVLLNMMVQLLR